MDDKVVSYADTVVSSLSAPDEFKTNLRRDLIRYILEAGKSSGIDSILQRLGSPESLSAEISKELYDNNARFFNDLDKGCKKFRNALEDNIHDYAPDRHHEKCKPKRYLGQYTREENEINIKLLYIPLIQIDSGTERIVKPILYDEEDCRYHY